MYCKGRSEIQPNRELKNSSPWTKYDIEYNERVWVNLNMCLFQTTDTLLNDEALITAQWKCAKTSTYHNHQEKVLPCYISVFSIPSCDLLFPHLWCHLILHQDLDSHIYKNTEIRFTPLHCSILHSDRSEGVEPFL